MVYYGQSNELPSFIERTEFLEQLSDCQHVKVDIINDVSYLKSIVVNTTVSTTTTVIMTQTFLVLFCTSSQKCFSGDYLSKLVK